MHSLREKSQIESVIAFISEKRNLENLVEELKDKDAHPVVYTYRDAHAVSLGLRYGVGFLLLFISTRVFQSLFFDD